MTAADKQTEQSYQLAQQRYAELGVDTGDALERLRQIPVSLHCWQGDDVRGFEPSAAEVLGDGLAVTGHYPGRARTADELREDLAAALSWIPGRHRVNLHAIYGDFSSGPVERNEIVADHFASWVQWAQERELGIDFNSTFFSHPRAADGFTLAHSDPVIRQYWIDHGRACRNIAAHFGKMSGSPSIHNVWIPDGFKDQPVDRAGPRDRLLESLDAMFQQPLPADQMLDAVESKLFGIGSESYVVGSHEFYLGYAATRQTLLCLDSGHFHPTESIADKISSVLNFVPGVLLHVSRGVRWDSDHVVIADDNLLAIAQEAVRVDSPDRIRFGLDYFDASIHRVAAWVIGTRCLLRALLLALLEPASQLRNLEHAGDFTARLALLEELKSMPFSAVWDYYCLTQDVPIGSAWLKQLRNYERDVTLLRETSPSTRPQAR